MTAILLHYPYIMLRLTHLFRRPETRSHSTAAETSSSVPPAPVEESPLLLDPSERTILLTIGEDLADKPRLPVPQLPDSAAWDLQGFHVVTPEGRRRYGYLKPLANTVEVSMRDGVNPQAGEWVCFTFRKVPEGAALTAEGTVRTDMA